MKWRNRQLRWIFVVLSFASIIIFCYPYSTRLFYSDRDNLSVSPTVTNKLKENSPQSQQNTVLETKIRGQIKRFPCDDLIPRRHFAQRGSYWILYNYAMARKTFRCDESITYTTHSDFRFLDNLIPLVQRWEGPVSVALYAPGSDYEETVNRIQYLRNCVSSLVKDFVSFHLYFDTSFLPKYISHKNSTANDSMVDCQKIPVFGVQNIPSFRQQKGLVYPVNVGRNVARDMSTTHHVLASDIELYPNPGLIPSFLRMIQRNDSTLRRNSKPKVFVVPIFEVESNVTALPINKMELQIMLREGTAVPFHKFVCEECHRFPKQEKWIQGKYKKDDELRVFHIGKRIWAYLNWEPLFIGTKWDPAYDERLTWEGQRDKMTQGYILCVLEYEFHILNNAFLVHRPGIKRVSQILQEKQDKTVTQPGTNKGIDVVTKSPAAEEQIHLINEKIWPELKRLYGHKVGCQS